MRYVGGHQRRAKDLKPPNPSALCMCGCGKPAPISKQTNRAKGLVAGHHTRYIPGHNLDTARIPLEKEAAICKRYRAGETLSQIADGVGVSAWTVWSVLVRNGIAPNRYLNERQEATINEMYIAGEKTDAIAKAVGRSPGAIYRVLRKYGTEPSRNRLRWEESEAAQTIRTLPPYKAWRKAVLQRDDYTCQQCGTRGGTLHVHHLRSFAEMLAEYRPITLEAAHSYDALWDVDNGLTLCDTCHWDAHGFIRNSKAAPVSGDSFRS